MRKIGGLAAGLERRFIPTAYGNSESPDPVVVWYRTPSKRQQREILAIGIRTKTKAHGETVIETDHGSEIAQASSAIQRLVTKVESYTAADGAPIADGAALAEHGEAEIFWEVYGEIMSSMVLTGQEKKALEPSPASS